MCVSPYSYTSNDLYVDILVLYLFFSTSNQPKVIFVKKFIDTSGAGDWRESLVQKS